MQELQKRLTQLTLRLDHMAMRCEQSFIDALDALENRDQAAASAINSLDSTIDREEVAIEQECIRLLALHQPAASDLRLLCTIIKVNSDLERIADIAASIARKVKRVVEQKAQPEDYPNFHDLKSLTLDTLGKTIRLLSATESSAAKEIIRADDTIDASYKKLVEQLVSNKAEQPERLVTMIQIAKAMERIGDHCTNIAEDIIFLRTGDIIRHTGN